VEQSQEVTLASVSTVRGSGSDTQHIDINLKLNERAQTGPLTSHRALFLPRMCRSPPGNFMKMVVKSLRDKKEQ
jgi:hypothetical protein